MTGCVLAADGVEIRYRGSASPAVVDASLEVEPGGSVAIVGESGSGKTTLANALVGLLEPSRGSVTIQGRPWRDVKPRDRLRRSVQMVFQDPYASLNPRLTPLEAVSEVIVAAGSAKGAAARDKAAALLDSVGIAQEAAGRRPSRLSGGQCQRVSLARALANEPDVLVADEPTSALDVSVQSQILALLEDLRASRGMALVLISHDLSVVRRLTSRVLVMYRGHLLEEGPTRSVLADARHPYTQVLLDAVPGHWGARRLVTNDGVPDTGCVFAPRCPAVDPGRCTVAQPPREPAAPDHVCACVRTAVHGAVNGNGA
jgi:oligopeptide/dipeptide ABC transporter ATP-binding protein